MKFKDVNEECDKMIQEPSQYRQRYLVYTVILFIMFKIEKTIQLFHYFFKMCLSMLICNIYLCMNACIQGLKLVSVKKGKGNEFPLLMRQFCVLH